MSWVAVGTAALGAVASSGGGGGGGAPAGPTSLDSGRVSFGDFNLAPKGSVSLPSWLFPVLAGVAGLVVIVVILMRRARR